MKKIKINTMTFKTRISIIAVGLIVVILFLPLLIKRQFFHGMKKDKSFFLNKYFFKIEKWPSFVLPYYLGYKYETNIYGPTKIGYLCSSDSVIYDISYSGKKFIFIDLRKNKQKLLLYKPIIPEINRISNNDWYEMFLLKPSDSPDTLIALQMKITYKSGIDSIRPVYAK